MDSISLKLQKNQIFKCLFRFLILAAIPAVRSKLLAAALFL